MAKKKAQAGTQLRKARALLEERALGGAELERRLAMASDAAYWRRLCPELSVGRISSAQPPSAALQDPQAAMRTAEDLRLKGYIEIGAVVSTALARRMREAVVRLRRAGWLAVFAFVFDEFWSLWSSPPINALLSRALGPDYRMIPHVWCWHVPAAQGAGGWPPHLDGLSRPGRVTVWTALSDATVANGCIYVVPRDMTAGLPITRMNSPRGLVESGHWRRLLHACRALPVRAGSALAWDFQVMHWGSMNHGGLSPRISIGVEFIRRDVRPASEERHLLEVGTLPDFLRRLWAIGDSIRLYRHRDLRNIVYLPFARRLCHRADRLAACGR